MTDWVDLSVETLRGARKGRGLSYEAMGRKLNVASKTYERWEKAGRVPRHMLRQVAETLDLEIDWPRRGVINVEERDPPDPVRQAIREELGDVYEILERIESRLEQVEHQAG